MWRGCFRRCEREVSFEVTTINTNLNKAWIEKEDDQYFYLKDTRFETSFANDINKQAKIAWNKYFSAKRGYDLNGTFKVGSIVDIVKQFRNGDKSVFPKNIEVVTGGFPCQDFSVSGKRKGFKSHKDHNGRIIDATIQQKKLEVSFTCG